MQLVMAEKFPQFGELFRSAEEHREPVKATIVGSIPVWLKGTLVRLGPGKFDLAEDFTLNHWLDGYAILYKFDIASDTEVWFSSQFLLSDAYKRAVSVGRPTASMTDNDAINIFTLEDEVYVATETNWLHRIDPKTLNTCEKNYVVLIEQPLTVNGLSLLTSLMKDKSLRECLEWRPQEKNKFHVLHKASGKLVPIKYKSEEAFFLFHHINTYEDEGQLIVDVFAYDSPEIIDKLYLQKLRNSEFSAKDPAGGRRFVLPLPKPN
ncbi:hypothetical protein B566_EDAN013381, partial [Ephemera danica]